VLAAGGPTRNPLSGDTVNLLADEFHYETYLHSGLVLTGTDEDVIVRSPQNQRVGTDAESAAMVALLESFMDRFSVDRERAMRMGRRPLYRPTDSRTRSGIATRCTSPLRSASTGSRSISVKSTSTALRPSW
jgi:hypothetical protein